MKICAVNFNLLRNVAAAERKKKKKEDQVKSGRPSYILATYVDRFCGYCHPKI